MDNLLTYEQIGERLGMNRVTIWKLIRKGEFPKPLKIGRAVRFRESEIQQWIEQIAEAQQGGAGPAA